MPEGFDEIYLCDLLKLPYSTLIKQPDWWVERMRMWLEQKNKAEEVRAEESLKKSK